ncbi:17080_t:CDS:1 [Dentiscutata erythropus]|uniref:17080_t:CDS:1 n=1 Tax=Dentiscutata erythropus TaxID=1348616 RepID=A0A9N9H179_9GLOM|nr:17080_t:CDS:1 [Dentiscutata erythropus]
MPESTKEQITSPNDTKPSSQPLPNGKKQLLTNVANSATNFLHAILPMDGKSTTANLSTLVNNITNQKPSTSSTSATSFLQEEWVTGQIYEDKSPEKFANHSASQSFNTDFNVEEWEKWTNSSEYSEHNNLFEMSKHKYPFHHHFHNQDSLHNSYQQDGIEVIDFLNSSVYTDEVYNPIFEDEKQISSGSFNKSEFKLDEFLETADSLIYLTQTRYTYDVYGMPSFFKRLVDEARDEIFNERDSKCSSEETNESHRRTGIERLKMVRDHLVKKKEQSTDNEMRKWLDNWTEKDMDHLWNN